MRVSGQTLETRLSQIQAATEVFSYKWQPLIFYAVHELEGAGYSEVDAALDGISSKMLSDGLSDLCERDILETTETVEDSGRTIYELSSRGRALVPVLHILESWNKHYEERRRNVMIVEDERMVASILVDYFSDSYNVQFVQTGEKAVDRYTEETDLLVLDRKLEGMSGDTAASQIRAEHEEALIIAVSGVKPDDSIVELSVDDYLYKPVLKDEVRNRLELLLNRAELGSSARTYLAFRSKQLALKAIHGVAGEQMDGYQQCTERIEALEMSSNEMQTLEPLLPSEGREPHSPNR